MPNQNAPTPISTRINRTLRDIRQNPGSDSELRDRLSHLRDMQQNRQGGGSQGGNQGGGGQNNNAPGYGGGGSNGPYAMPWSATYQTDIAQAGQNLQFAQQETAYDQATLEREYGFNDTSDPFSRAAQLQHNYENAQRGTLNNYAASGQLYAGSLNNANDIDRRNYDESYHGLRQDYESRLHDILLGGATAQRTYDEAVAYANAGNLDSALSEPVNPAEAGGGGGGGGGGGNRPPRPGPNFHWSENQKKWIRN